MNDIIRERRIAKKLTQEQVADCLGVTTPAVNKWEKGVSYPDITLLPILARLLDTDLNTLMSFQEDLSNLEITLLLNSLAEMLDTDGFETVYKKAIDKMKEFPTCYSLWLGVAMFLDGALTMHPNVENSKEYKQEIETFYQRALCSEEPDVCNQAKAILISRYRERKEFEKAESLLRTLPDKSPVDKKQIQASIYVEMGKLEEAAKIEEERLLSNVNESQTILTTLMEIALKQNRIEDAEYIANIAKQNAQVFDQWEYSRYVVPFQFYVACKKPIKVVQELVPMLKSLTQEWKVNDSPLYRHIQTKHTDSEFGVKQRERLITWIRADKENEFLTNSDVFEKALKKFETEKQ